MLGAAFTLLDASIKSHRNVLSLTSARAAGHDDSLSAEAPFGYGRSCSPRQLRQLSLVVAPAVHVPTPHPSSFDCVLPMRDGLPKFADFPAAFGGSDKTVPE
jgi:hypothetical protein